MKCIYIDGQAGAAGDMLLAAFADLGVSIQDLAKTLTGIMPAGFSAEAKPTSVCGISAKRLKLEFPPAEHHRKLADIMALLDSIELPARVREQVGRIFHRLAEAEAHVHSSTVADVHFHEVGADDAIFDIVGSAWALAELGVEKVYCAPLVVGSGVGRSAHGPIHYPAPAVMEILKGCPIRVVADLGETTTPTGAAILAEVAEFTDSVMLVPERVGYGAGTRELSDRPNLLRATLGDVSDTFLTDQLWVAASDIDNTRPEVFEWLAERLRGAGAIDVTLTDVAMKKGRHGTRVEALCADADRSKIAEAILTETASLGVRWTVVTRTKLPRHSEIIDSEWGPIRVKVASSPNGERRGVPEYDDCRVVAEKTGVPLLTVMDTVTRLFAESRSDNRENAQKG